MVPVANSIMQAAPPAPFFIRIRAWWRALRAPADPIAELMAARLGMVQRGEYQPLGTILMLQTEAGWIQFPTRTGPALARFADGGIDLLDPWDWNLLPDRYDGTTLPCSDCAKAPCNECFPEDQFGGLQYLSGKAAHVLSLLPGERPCTYGSQVECCGGIGVIPSQDNKTCPSCGGSGKVKCHKCQGTAEMSTGFVDWDNDLRESPSGKFCPSCGGSGKARKVIEQRLLDHLPSDFQLIPCTTTEASIHPTFWLGPVLALMVSTPPNNVTQPWKCSPDGEGDFPHIVSRFRPGARAVILGGVLRPETRTPRRNNDG